jgi:hypothetical protein
MVAPPKPTHPRRLPRGEGKTRESVLCPKETYLCELRERRHSQSGWSVSASSACVGDRFAVLSAGGDEREVGMAGR